MTASGFNGKTRTGGKFRIGGGARFEIDPRPVYPWGGPAECVERGISGDSREMWAACNACAVRLRCLSESFREAVNYPPVVASDNKGTVVTTTHHEFRAGLAAWTRQCLENDSTKILEIMSQAPAGPADEPSVKQ